MAQALEWSPSPIIFPRNTLISHIHLHKPRFVPSFENDHCKPSMNFIMGMEYARIWHREHEQFIKDQKQAERNYILQRKRRELQDRKKAKLKKQMIDAKKKSKEKTGHKELKKSPKCYPSNQTKETTKKFKNDFTQTLKDEDNSKKLKKNNRTCCSYGNENNTVTKEKEGCDETEKPKNIGCEK